MDYAIYLLKSKRGEIIRLIRSYKRAINKGEILNYTLDVGTYEDRIGELNKAIKKLEG